MEYYKVFAKVLLKEIAKFNLDTEVYSSYVNQLTPSLTENFDVPYNRCAYMFRCATANMYFFNDCIKKFLNEYSNTKDVLTLWKSYSEVKVCSLTVGPGIDYLGFLLAILEYDSSPPNFNGVKIVSKHGAWRNTINLISEVFREQGTSFGFTRTKLKYDNVGVFHVTDLLKSYTNNRTIVAVNEANVILMMKTLNLVAAGTPQEGPLLYMLKKLIGSLKSEAIIFCIDTKPSVAVLSAALLQFPGKYLYGPIHQAIRLPCDFPEVFESHPIVSTRGAFCVWQKLPSSTPSSLCTTPIANTSFAKENKSGNLSAASSSDDISYSPTVKNRGKIEDKDSDSNLKNILYGSPNLQNTMHKGNSSDSLSPSCSLSSFTCEDDSSSSIIEGSSTGTIPKSSGTFLKNNSTKVNDRGDNHQDIPPGSSSVKELTEKIKQLAISLESVSQQNEPRNCNCGNFNGLPNYQTEGLHSFPSHNNAYTASCSKQSPSCSFKTQDSLPSYETQSEKNVPLQNRDCHSSCRMHCCTKSYNFQPCCAPHPAQRCSSSCSRQTTENNFGDLTSPSIVIPVQNISENALLQIIAILKSESKN